jgi:hypothetical protein
VLVGGAMVGSMVARPGIGAMAGALGVFVGVVFLGIAVLYAVIGVGFLKLQNWARILVIVLSALGVLLNGLGILTGLVHLHPLLAVWRLISLGINLWIALYLLKPHVKQAFGATGF